MQSAFITGADLLHRNVQKLPVLLDPLLPKVGIVGLAGESSAGKSSFLFQLAKAVVYGEKDFLEFPLQARHGRAIIVATEDSEDSIALKLGRYKDQPDAAIHLKGLKFLFDSSNLLQKLTQEVQRESIDLLILDCFTDLYGDDMNSTNRVRTYLNSFNELAVKHHFLIIILHHSQKRSQYLMPSKDNLLGSQGFEAKCRLVIELRRDLKDADLRHMCLVKANYLPQSYTQQSFVLHFNDQQEFTNTGGRDVFENLVMSKDQSAAGANPLQEKINDLYQSGIITVRDITAKLNEQGIKVGKTKVSELLKNCPSVRNPKDTRTDGHAEESDTSDDE